MEEGEEVFAGMGEGGSSGMTKAEAVYYGALREIEILLFKPPRTEREARILFVARAVLNETVWTCRICEKTWARDDLFYSEGDCPTEDCGTDEDLSLSIR